MFIKDFPKYQIFQDGSVLGPKGNFLKPWIGRGGYLKVCLAKGIKKRWVYIHRLVCEAFIDNPLNKKEINHLDGNKLNNYFTNLEWVTRSENNYHAFRTGLKKGKRGEDNYSHKLSKKQVEEIRVLKGKRSQRELEKIYGVSHSHISKIQRNLKWEVPNV